MKHFLAILFFIGVSLTSTAQLQFGFQLGANLPASGVALPGFIEVDRDGTQHALIATLGAGINFNGMLGYKFHPNIVANLEFGYFKGFEGGFHAYVAPNTDSKMDIAFAGRYIHVTPGVTIQATKDGLKLQPFTRFGLIIAGASVESTQTPTNITGLSGQAIDKYSGGTSLGFLGALGVKKPLNFRMDLVLELTVKSLTTTPKTLENLQNFNGMEKNPTVNFVETLPPGSPDTDQLAMTLPFSSFGLSVGFIYNLSN